MKPFVNPRYDMTTRTFTGTIDWSDNYFDGDARWEYEMVFYHGRPGADIRHIQGESS